MQIYKIALPVNLDVVEWVTKTNSIHTCIVSEDPTKQIFLVESHSNGNTSFKKITFYRPEYESISRQSLDIDQENYSWLMRLKDQSREVHKVQTKFCWQDYMIEVDEFIFPKLPYGIVCLDLATWPNSKHLWPKGFNVGEEIHLSYNRMIWKLAHGEEIK